jgi:ribosome-associated protein
MRTVEVRGDGIRLGQFLKLADLVDSGSDAKPLLAAGEVQVNGVEETRRGRQLVDGDVVRVGDEQVRVAAGPSSGPSTARG